jgi:hypothetical protein
LTFIDTLNSLTNGRRQIHSEGHCLSELGSRDSDELRAKILAAIDLVKGTAVVQAMSVKSVLRDLRDLRGGPILRLGLRRGISGSERNLLGVGDTEVVSKVELNEGLGELKGRVIGRSSVDEGNTTIVLTTDKEYGNSSGISVEENGNGALTEEHRGAVSDNSLKASTEALESSADKEEVSGRATRTRGTAAGNNIVRASDDGNDTTKGVAHEGEVVRGETTEDAGVGIVVEGDDEVLGSNSNEGRGLLDTLTELREGHRGIRESDDVTLTRELGGKGGVSRGINRATLKEYDAGEGQARGQWGGTFTELIGVA